MTLNLIETFKTSISSPKHTKNTKIPFCLFKLSEKSNYLHGCSGEEYAVEIRKSLRNESEKIR